MLKIHAVCWVVYTQPPIISIQAPQQLCSRWRWAYGGDPLTGSAHRARNVK